MPKATKSGSNLGWALTAAAAIAGAYYFYGKDGHKHRKQLKGWMVKIKGEVMEKLENMKELSEKSYYQAVDEVIGKYKKAKKIAPKELAGLSKELKAHWSSMKDEILAS